MSLGQMFSLGLGFIIVLMISLVIVSFSAIGHISEIFLEYRGNSRTTIALNANLEDILEARTAALKYRDQPSETLAQEVRSNLREFIEDAKSYDEATFNDEKTSEIRALITVAEQYHDAFDKGTKLQSQIRELVQRLSALGPSAREDLTVALSLIASEGENKNTHAAALAIQTTMLGRFYTERFLVQNETRDIHRAFLEFTTAFRIIDSISSANEDADFMPRLGAARAKISEYVDTAKEIHSVVLQYLALQRNTMDSLETYQTYRIDKPLA